MNRNVKKTVSDYEKLVSRQNSNRYTFYLTDVKGILSMDNESVYDVVFNSFEFAFMIGYRAAKQEQIENS